MPRASRAASGGFCYHVLNRGNARAEVFHKKDGDYGAFVKIIGQGSTSASSQVTRAGWLGSSWRQPAAPSAEASDLGASPFGRRPQPPRGCNRLLNHAVDSALRAV